jgi:hypothetical protein
VLIKDRQNQKASEIAILLRFFFAKFRLIFRFFHKKNSKKLGIG